MAAIIDGDAIGVSSAAPTDLTLAPRRLQRCVGTLQEQYSGTH